MPRLQRINYGRGHGYKIDGVKVDGVTTAISTGYPINLKQWAANTAAEYAINNWDELAGEPIARRLDRIRYSHRETLNAAALRGTEIHALGEAVVYGREVDVPAEHRGPVEAYARFLDDWEIEPIAVESPVASLTHRYGGTTDLTATIGVHDGERALVDLKTGRGIYESVALQLAAYTHAEVWQPDGPDSEEDLPPVDAVYVAHIGPDDVRLLPVEVSEATFRTFLYVLHTSRWINAHGWNGDERVVGDALRRPERNPA